ncbi:MAG: restriction endonuclease subunit S [Sutterella wadsworthensis]|nr:restriction endonuclease subunit S [Sutterella wadsworthensis]
MITSKLKDLIDLIIDYRGKTPKKLGGDWSESGYRVFSAKNIKTGEIVSSESIRYVNNDLYRSWMKDEIQKGDILITSEAPFGQIYFWDSDEKIVLGQRLFAIRPKKSVNGKYLYYYMTGRDFQCELKARATGTTVTGLRQPELLQCQVSMPSKEQQDYVAHLLGTLDKKIQINVAINDNLLKLWEARTRKLLDSAATTPTLIGEICRPKQWKTLTKSELTAGAPIDVYGAGGVIGQTREPNHNERVIGVVCRGVGCGTLMVIDPPSYVTGNVMCLDNITNQVGLPCLYAILKDRGLSDIVSGSAQPQITGSSIKNTYINLPNYEVCNRITKEGGKTFDMININKRENEHLTRIRDLLLSKLF